ncbi:MAG: VOC family protein [Spirochaeta sp.]|nr:VOC family protein [Spirochaeta sp.]
MSDDISSSQSSVDLSPKFCRLEYRTPAYEPLAALYKDALGLNEVEPGLLRSVDGGFELAFKVLPDSTRDSETTVGLYHVAFLLPSRAALAATLRRVFAAVRSATERRAETAAPDGARSAAVNGFSGPAFFIEGATDHLVSEAVYLRDADGNGVELYADRDPSEWRRDAEGNIAMDTVELDMAGLLASAPSTEGICAGSSIGHLHFHVPDLDSAEAFYRKNLGLKVTQRRYPGARFLAWGGYHHHLGINTWAKDRRAPQGAAGLVRVRLSEPPPGASPSSGAEPQPGAVPRRELGPDPAGIIWSW